ncbi:MAG: hypothetical protein VX278_23635, partial [Myxococcota bacterium]|nr:hypothetical protein [Myxococcota bacterium]
MQIQLLLFIGCQNSAPKTDTVTQEDTLETEYENEEEYEEYEEETNPNEGRVTNNTPISSLSAGINEFTLNQVVAGVAVERRFLVHTPADFNDSQHKPLLFGFHGNGGTPEDTMGDMMQAVEEGFFIGVYPEGLEYSWNLGLEDS